MVSAVLYASSFFRRMLPLQDTISALTSVCSF